MKVVDSIAYMNHDLDDAIRAGILASKDIPSHISEALGDGHASRINTLVLDLIANSELTPGSQGICLSDHGQGIANALRDFLFETVYDPINQLEQTRRAGEIVIDLFKAFCRRPETIPDTIPSREDEPLSRRAADAVASMTDRYALELHERITPQQILVP